MFDESTCLTTIEAAQIAGCTSRHITNLINRGELSASRRDNKYIIDKSEFYRVFPQTMKKEKEPINPLIMSENSRLSSEISLLKELCKSKDKEIEFLKNLIEVSNNEKQKLLESINAHTRLLEHKESGSSSHSSSRRSWSELFKRKKT